MYIDIYVQCTYIQTLISTVNVKYSNRFYIWQNELLVIIVETIKVNLKKIILSKFRITK